MDTVYINSVADFLRIIEEQSYLYRSNGDTWNPVQVHFLYRGMENINYKLLPSLYRYEDVSSTQFGREYGKEQTLKYLSYGHEFNVLFDFIHEAAAYEAQIGDHEFYRWVVLAQHHGVPTRLLDWTSNPLVSLYFACQSNSSTDAVVWMLHSWNYMRYALQQDIGDKNVTIPELLNRIMKSRGKDASIPSHPLIYTPNYFDHRMSAQRSYFLVWGAKTEPLEDLIDPAYHMISLEQARAGDNTVDELHDKRCLYRVAIRAQYKQKIIRQLDLLGINAKTLFPGLDGIGQYVERKYRFDSQEALGPIMPK